MGSTGYTGYPGMQGQYGLRGESGLPGGTGATGYTGATGLVGNTGPQGITGSTGAQGYTGILGDTGGTGYTGPPGPPAAIGLRVDLDVAASKAFDQQTVLRSTTSTLSTITIGLIAWAVAITVAIAVMTALIVRRMRMIRARAQRLSAVTGRDSPLYAADDDSECPQLSGTEPRTSVISVDFGDLSA
jgi:hypothetical protein